MTEQGKSLRRIMILLKLISADMEWFAMGLPEQKKKKWLRIYKERGVDWILRDLITDAKNPAVYETIMSDLSSDRIKDLHEWIDLGADCDNIEDVISVIKQSVKN